MSAASAAHEPVLIYEDHRTRVTRLLRPGGSVVCKEPLGPGAERLQHERAILERLAGVPGVVQLAEPAVPGTLTMEDVDGIPLSDIPMPMPPGALIQLGLKLGRTLAAVHDRGVMHRNLCPANLLVVQPGGAPTLTGFGLATTFAEVRPQFSAQGAVGGAVPYLAPEQTGRTGRPVDQRSDLYALGAILYERATGFTPFDATDPLKLVHDQLTRVPSTPAELRPNLPEALSAIIMHLLETEPDDRYQTAEGLVHDLDRLRRTGRRSAGRFPVGEEDFPLQLRSPSRPVGRDREIVMLAEALAGANAGRSRAVFVSGASGIGKSALVDQLRPVVAASNGWFVAGKFDQYRRDQDFDAVRQAFRSLARFLLAEPGPELATLRARLLQVLGDNADLLATVVPEFTAVLEIVPGQLTGDPFTAAARLQQTGVEVLRVIASPKRPVVFVVDDLQWATQTPLGFLDTAMNDDDLDGLLLVGTFRDQDVDPTHPLAVMLARWQREQRGVEHLRLTDLPRADLAALLAEMLRLDTDRAAALAGTVAPHTQGNPFATVELLNSLRHHNVLVPSETGWHWDPDRLASHLGRGDTSELLAERTAAMPPATRELLQAMACLGGQTTTGLLHAATDLSSFAVEERLASALEGGLLVLEPGEEDTIRFRHDHVRDAMLRDLDTDGQRALRLRLARRLAQRPELFPVAADMYLPVADAVPEPAERRQVAELLRVAADQAKLTSNHQVVERMLAGALTLLEGEPREVLIETLTDRHAALVSLGRLSEADEIYAQIIRRCERPAERVPATLAQLASLTSRNRPGEALELGAELLQQLGHPVPAPDLLLGEVQAQLPALARWVAEAAVEDPRPDIAEPDRLGAAAVFNRMMSAAYLGDHLMLAWLSTAAWRMWVEVGPSPDLVGPMSYLGYLSLPGGDYRTATRTAARVVAVSRARGYEPATSEARWVYALLSCWSEPLEEGIRQAREARQQLIHSGDLPAAAHTYHASVYPLLDCAPTIDSYLQEAESGLAFASRIGDDQSAAGFDTCRRFARVLRGELARTELPSPESYLGNPPGQVGAHIARAVAAAIFGDADTLAQHSAAALSQASAIMGAYPIAVAHALRALSLAEQARGCPEAERGALVAELDTSLDWLAARSADAPVNFQHLVRLAEAERAWVLGGFRPAARAFDAALQAASGQHRPWHRALAFERGARFCLAHGLEYAGQQLLAQTRQAYAKWGAAAKADQLDWAYPELAALGAHEPQPEQPGPAGRQATVTSGTIDLLGILAASQALSSETSVEGLRARVVEVLGSMTGATSVRLVLWDERGQGWLADRADGGQGEQVEEADPGQLPVSAIRYVERTREPLVVEDATQDDRFARDPYFAALDRCALLAAPVLSQGRMRAVLLLENRLIRGAFATGRLDGVMMIAGQLAVSLDNALIYASLERRVAERTEDLAEANQRLARLSVTDALTGLANRRRLEEVLSAEWLRSQRSGEPVSVAMVDIDGFKLYNDQYGHAAGDHCLQRVAAALAQQVRQVDLVARYGGEEFAVVMPATRLETAIDIGERLRVAVAELGEEHAHTPDRMVTVSIGVAAMAYAPQRMVEHLIEGADAQLYRAKRAGRNRVRPNAGPGSRPGGTTPAEAVT